MENFENFCPVRDILARIGDKGSVLVMHSLSTKEVMRFGELQREIPDVSQ